MNPLSSRKCKHNLEYLERLRAVYEPQIGKPLEVKPMGPGKGSKRIKDPIINKWYWDKCKVAG